PRVSASAPADDLGRSDPAGPRARRAAVEHGQRADRQHADDDEVARGEDRRPLVPRRRQHRRRLPPDRHRSQLLLLARVPRDRRLRPAAARRSASEGPPRAARPHAHRRHREIGGAGNGRPRRRQPPLSARRQRARHPRGARRDAEEPQPLHRPGRDADPDGAADVPARTRWQVPRVVQRPLRRGRREDRLLRGPAAAAGRDDHAGTDAGTGRKSVPLHERARGGAGTREDRRRGDRPHLQTVRIRSAFRVGQMKLAFALAVLLAAQQEPFVETIEVRLHNVDVVVTDRAGNPVRSLRVEDFELLEDGKPQKITNFAEYGEEETRTSQPAVAHGTPGAAPSVAAAPAPAAALPPPPRKVVFFVDEMSVHPQSRGRLAKSAAELLDRTLRPGDEAVVIRPTETIALDFSDDVPAVRAALVKAIEENTYRTDIAFAAEMRAFLQEASRAINEKDRRQIARRHAAKVKRRVEKRLAALRGIIATLAPLQGRRIIITLTESLPAQPGKEFFGVQGRLNVTPGAF